MTRTAVIVCCLVCCLLGRISMAHFDVDSLCGLIKLLIVFPPVVMSLDTVSISDGIDNIVGVLPTPAIAMSAYLLVGIESRLKWPVTD